MHFFTPDGGDVVYSGKKLNQYIKCKRSKEVCNFSTINLAKMQTMGKGSKNPKHFVAVYYSLACNQI